MQESAGLAEAVSGGLAEVRLASTHNEDSADLELTSHHASTHELTSHHGLRAPEVNDRATGLDDDQLCHQVWLQTVTAEKAENTGLH